MALRLPPFLHGTTSGDDGSRNFLRLDRRTRADAYAYAAQELGRTQTAIEKDVWLCWVLNVLFSTPHRPALAFKGGTSLSKCHDVIQRFSEDVDLTMRLTDVNLAGLSRQQRDRAVNELRSELINQVTTVFFPHMQDAAADIGAEVTIAKEGEELHLAYPTAVAHRESYYREVVRVEFGARAGIDPSSRRTLTPYLAPLFNSLAFPVAEVDVLNAERTFWEKFTLAHAESGRTAFKNHERFSRHWYDLAMLGRHSISSVALANLDLLDAVVVMKDALFRVGGVDYNDCATGNARLIPGKTGCRLLEADYAAMIQAGMIEGSPPTFAEVVDGVRDIERRSNERTVGRAAPVRRAS